MSIKNMDPHTVQELLNTGEAILVDVREAGEVQRERIPAAHHLPLSAFNPGALPDLDGKIVVYHCATGTRTGQFGMHLAAAAPEAKDVFHLSGGIMAWKMAGYETDGAGQQGGFGMFPNFFTR